jgi:hypothetical protein
MHGCHQLPHRRGSVGHVGCDNFADQGACPPLSIKEMLPGWMILNQGLSPQYRVKSQGLTGST